jgi:hypothetical protein
MLEKIKQALWFVFVVWFFGMVVYHLFFPTQPSEGDARGPHHKWVYVGTPDH